MTRTESRRLKWMVSGGGILWMVVVGGLMWATLPNDSVMNLGSDQVQTRMSECGGSFRDRYDCKERILIDSGRETFYSLAARFLLVILPPLISTLWLSAYLARQPIFPEKEHPHHHDDDGDWKARARLHTQIQSPGQAAAELHLHNEDIPPHASPRSGHHPIDDIAPVDDWKTQAQNHIRGRKDQ